MLELNLLIFSARCYSNKLTWTMETFLDTGFFYYKTLSRYTKTKYEYECTERTKQKHTEYLLLL